MRIRCLPLILISLGAQAQGYTNWRTGNAVSITTQPQGGACLMGGNTENDEAMKWFLQRASGGDVLLLRASGSNGYNNYFYSELGMTINSVETIRFDNASAAADPYVHQRIVEAEAIWFAGGDQWNYVSYWRGTAIESLINEAITERNIVIGGTSAGMAILGGAYFTAQVGSVTSAQALADPYHPAVTVSTEPFLQVPRLGDVVTDTHYNNPDRRGRHTVFMARLLTDHGIDAKGIACNDYVAVCVDTEGQARVFGEWPQFNDYAYFVQINCEEPDGPETITAGVPLTWDRNGQALKVYRVPGTMQGTHTFDLNDWRTGSGGTWSHWRVINGVLAELGGTPAVDCVQAPQVFLAVKAHLQGPYDALTNLMRDDLRQAGLIPGTEPYTALGYGHAGGGGGETVQAGVLGVAGDDAIVDWVVLELRDATEPSVVLSTRSALIQRDGDVVDTDGLSPVLFQTAPGNYHVALRHRNHLGVMTAAPLELDAVPTPIDLRLPGTPTHGTVARAEQDGTMLLWCGDVNTDGQLR